MHKVRAVSGGTVKVRASGGRGVPGVNAIPADDFIAGRVADPASATATALSDAIAGSSAVTGKVGKGTLFINVKDHGATGDGVTDDSAAVQAWLTAVVTNDAVGYAPDGDYLMNTAAVRTDLDGHTITLAGGGIGATRFIVPASNTTGAIHLSSEVSRASQVTMRDFTVLTRGTGAGTGIKATLPMGGNQHQRSLVMENVEVKGEDIASHVFAVGIDVAGNWRPYLRNVLVAGPWGPGVTTNKADDSPLYVGTAACIIDDSYDYTVDNCHFWGYSTALRDVGTEAEAGRVVNTVMAEGKVGFHRVRTTPEPIIWLDNCHLNNRDRNIHINGAKLAIIRGSHPYNEDGADNTPTLAATDILLENTERTIIANNVFHFDGAADRINIDVVTTTLGTNVLVQGNIFSGAVARAVRVGAGASSVLIIGNVYPGTIAKRVEDNSGTAVVLDHTAAGEMSLESFGDSSAAGPVLSLRRDSASPAANDVIGALRSYGRNSAAAWVQYGLMDTQLVDPVAGTEDGAFRMWAMVNGAITRIANFQGPADAGDTSGMFLLTRIGGTDVIKRVEVGAADTGGTGFRVLRVAN